MGHRSRSSLVVQDRLLLNREHQLSQLCRALDGALRGRGQIVLIAGEAGMGKTTLAQAFAARANARGARVVWGRSGDREGSPPYWPWTEVLRAIADDESTDVRYLRNAFAGIDAAVHFAETSRTFNWSKLWKESAVPS